MRTILRAVVVLSIISVLCHAEQVNLPVYFVSGDSNTSSCQVFDSLNPTHITSSRLEFTDGQRIDFLNARSGVPCTGEEVENHLSVFTGHDPSKWRTHLPISLGPCDINQDNAYNLPDALAVLKQALGTLPAVSDLNADGTVNVVDVQVVENAAQQNICVLH